jgi:hypothetical protein
MSAGTARAMRVLIVDDHANTAESHARRTVALSQYLVLDQLALLT